MSRADASRIEALTALRETEGRINTDEEVVLANVGHALRLGLTQVRPEPVKRARVVLVCGGPSLEATLPELREQALAGHRLVAVNGTARWLLERNLRPSAQVILDARPDNTAFVTEAVPNLKYLLASQCDPAVFEAVRGREVHLFHALTYGDAEKELLDRYYLENWVPVTGGTTVGVRSLALLRTLGYVLFDVYGLDSCWLSGRHHAFEQELNHRDLRYRVETAFQQYHGEGVSDLGRRTFECAPWHMQQVADFQKLVAESGEHFRINVHGDGLIGFMMRTGAAIVATEEER